MAQTSEQRSFIVSFVKVPELNKQQKMRQSIKVLTNQGEKWLNITQEPWLSPQVKNQSVGFEVWMYNERMYGKLVGNTNTPNVGLPASQGIPQGQGPPQQSRQGPKAPQTGQSDQEKATRLSIERQTAIKAACEFYTSRLEAPDEAVLEFAQKVAYFISTGYKLADKEKIDNEERQAAADISNPPQREPGDDEPPPDDEPAF